MRHIVLRLFLALSLAGACSIARAQYPEPRDHNRKFEQLGTVLPTPNEQRAADGAPGPGYWQQRADYDMQVRLWPDKQAMTGEATVTYYNNSPHELRYLWLQLDQNLFQPNSDANLTETGDMETRMSFDGMKRLLTQRNFDGGFKIEGLTDAEGRALKFTVVKTMMRVDLPGPVPTGKRFTFNIAWRYNVPEQKVLGGRGGYEKLPDGELLFEMAQFFPRMAVYDDVHGWQHKQFLGRGEFALAFGDYRVRITAPADYLVAAGGELLNPGDVLSAEQRKRLDQARNTFDKPVLIVTEDEAKANAKQSPATATRTWDFRAKNVRDFAWAACRKFIWDAMATRVNDKTPLAMSYYPPEGNPLWGQYSTQAVAHTLRVYSRYTFDYPYPVAISVNGPVGGMEYPMICFNGPRPEPDGTYNEYVKRALISVVIHEVGHNYFPMIVNSDERQWTWMDEGMNSFVQYLAECEWSRGYQSRRGPAENIVGYMKGDKKGMTPIMTNSEQIFQFGNNAYGKPATAFNILRETVLGRELFDFAFKEYCRRWMFRHPEPADFFRTMEDASGIDLDWFWRGWFYTVDHVDVAVERMTTFRLDTEDPAVEKPLARAEERRRRPDISTLRNGLSVPRTLTEENPAVRDFYDAYDPHEVTWYDQRVYQRIQQTLTEEERALYRQNLHFCQVDFRNIGGLVTPLILEFTFEDGDTQTVRIPAEIWRRRETEISKVFAFEKPVVSVQFDPWRETADTDESNNAWPPRPVPSQFELYRERRERGMNPMQRQQRIEQLRNRPDAVLEE